MKLKKRATMIVQTAAASVLLTACVATDTTLETAPDFVPEPVLDAATLAALAEPYESQKEFQLEVNGAPDDTAIEKNTVQGKEVTTEMYWYEATSMVVFFTHAEGETWCNVWNESGIVWDR